MGRRVHIAELCVSAVTLAIAALFLWDARRYAASPFEPIGSGAVPGGVAAAALLLGLMMLVSALRGLRSARGTAGPPELAGKVLAAFLLTIAYASVLAWGQVRYAVATAAFVLLGVMVVAEKPMRLLPWAAGIALTLGLGLDLVFRHLFVTNIP